MMKMQTRTGTSVMSWTRYLQGANPLLFLLTLLGSSLTTALSSAELSLPDIFSDHMVLQQNLKAPIWGTAGADAAITVRFRGQTQNAKADAQGKWRVQLDPLVATADQTGSDLVVESSSATIAIHDVVVGEVWLGAGQSNMALPCSAEKQYQGARPEDIASATFPNLRLIGNLAATKNKKNVWQTCTPESIPEWSALMFYTGRNLHQELKIPIGLIVTGVGLTSANVWMTSEDFMADEGCRKAWANYCEVVYPRLKEEYPAKIAEWDRLYGSSTTSALQKGAQKPPRPVMPKGPPNPKGPNCGSCYKSLVPVVGYAIRGMVWDQGESGSGVDGVEWNTAMVGLISGWRRAWGQEFPVLYVQKPSGLGRAFGDRPGRIPKDSREDPLLTQVARGFSRVAYQSLEKYPDVAMCVAVDLNGSLHPCPKDRYGKRMAQLALGKVYGKFSDWMPPQYAKQTVVGNQIRLDFQHIGKGLTTPKDEPVTGFAIAGSDRNFVWAQAKIDGDSVVVWSDQVPAPVAVRYAWAAQVQWANLFGKNELPVLTFRTDDWPQEIKP